MNKKSIIGLAVACAIATSAAVMAAVSFDAATGTGFAGKGDVQLIYGWSNKQLQDNHQNVKFRALSSVVAEVSWECTNANNDKVQERERTTTTSIAGILSSVGRLRNQITGFILEGYDGSPTETSSSEGPAVNSCPSGPWTLTTPAGEPVVVSSSSILQVSIGGDWTTLP